MAERIEGFDNRQEALRTLASHLAGSAEANGLGNELDGMGVRADDLTAAQELRAAWALDEVCRRLRNMGEERKRS